MSKGERKLAISNQLKAFEKELAENISITSEMTKRKKVLEKKIKHLKNSLSQFKSDSLSVSDHAVLRYAERHFNVKVDEIRKEISEKLKGAELIEDFKFMGFVVTGNTVVTYVGVENDPRT